MDHASPAMEHLNEQQRAAVVHGDGPLLVVAGAGTGKTRVITERIRALLEARPEISGENILGLTYTRKAAAEMKQRVTAAAGERGAAVWLGTFHSFCEHVVLGEIHSDLRVLEEIDHWILLRRRMAELELEQYARLADPGQFLNDFIKFFSRCQDELVTADDYQRYADRLRAEFEAAKATLSEDQRKDAELEVARQQEIARAYRASHRLLQEQNLWTFGRLLLAAVEELKKNPARRRELQQRYRYVLVDEFQDTNIAQIELLWLLAGDHRNIFAVGDDDQAIYRFRGASFGSFKLFAEKFLGKQARRGPEHALALTRNYRSTRRILRVAGHAISLNLDRYIPDKRLVTENPEGEKIRIAEFARPEAEAHWVAAEIARRHRAGEPWRSFAALYRMHAHRDALVTALARAGIPFVIRNLSILSHPLVRDVLAYLRLVEAPSDNIACARVLAAPYWGLDPEGLVRLAQRASKGKGRTLLEEVANPQGGLPFAPDEKRVVELVAWHHALRLRANRCGASEFLDELIADLGLALPADNIDRRYLERLTRFVREWEAKGEGKRLSDFVEYLDYFFEARGEINLEEAPAEDAVQLMTVHAAKGLEFDHVFLLQMNRNAFPPSKRPVVLEFPAALMKEEKPEGDFRIQEERRLFYVALTRARRSLTLTTVVAGRAKWSPFLEDLLSEPQLKRADIEQLSPEVVLPETEGGAASDAVAAGTQLFGAADPGSRAYSRIAQWAQGYHPPLSEPLSLSASAIENYKTCPLKYLLDQVWDLRGGPQAQMTFGNVMHSTIRHFVGSVHKGRTLPFEDVVAIYNREWSSAGFRDSFQEEEYRKAGLKQLRAFWESYTASPAEVAGQEKFFELPMEPNVLVTGRIDQINRLGTRDVEIVDYKTGRPRTRKDAQESLQLSIYALAAREALELQPTRLVFYNLTTNEAVAAARDDKALGKARQTVAEAADQIRAGEFPARPGFACRSCEFRPICPAHEQLVSIRPAQSEG